MGRTFVWAVIGGVFCLSLGASGCSDGNVTRADPPYSMGGEDGTGATNAGGDGVGATGNAGGMPSIPAGQGVGDDCSESECREGLTCNSKNKCEPAGDKEVGDRCVISAECADGQCLTRQCVAAGEGEAGTECRSDADCGAGLRCAISGLSVVCTAEGAGDVGADCATSLDCFGGLGCFAEKCSVAPPGVPPFGQPFQGVDCDPPADSNIKAYFEVPGADGADENDFFRLPFPTDVRRSGNQLDLSKFPTPGSGLLGVDPVQLYVDAITDNDSGWGAYPTVIFRFSGPFDFATFPRDAVQFIDVTDPATARSVGWQRFYTDARTNYICDNFVAVQPPFGSPLEPGHTYAVFINGDTEVDVFDDDGKKTGTKTVTLLGADDGEPVTASDNMVAVMKNAAPSDPKLKAAHAALAPLRAYLAAKSLPATNVLTASVITVGQVREPMADLAAAVAKAPVPTATQWTKCADGVKSPCDQGDADEGRGCDVDEDGYDEYQALLEIPVYQQGEAPYLAPADGGGIDTKKPHNEQVCMSITVPEGTAPTAGWPTVVFAHGTGGNFRNHVRPEVAGALAGTTPKFAVIGIDQVEHGPRRGTSDESPNNLFFNFLNPAVTRGNPLQGAADQLSVARFAKTLDVDAQTTGGEAIKLDGSKLFFFGHSQGSTEGSLMLPFGDDFKAAVLSGNGASLRDALQTKTKPENIAAALPLVLQDPLMSDSQLGSGVTNYHPVLSLLQQWIDPADPLSFAAVIGAPLQGHTGKSVFQTFGLEDSYSPPDTLATFALAGSLTQIAPDSSAGEPYEGDLPRDNDDKPLVVDPGYQGTGVTLGFRQYGPPKGKDGHFVVFDVPAANEDMQLFFTSAAGTSPPVIGQ